MDLQELSLYTKERICVYLEEIENDLAKVMKRMTADTAEMKMLQNYYESIISFSTNDGYKLKYEMNTQDFCRFFEILSETKKILQGMSGYSLLGPLVEKCGRFESLRDFWESPEGSKESIENGFRKGELLELQQELEVLHSSESRLGDRYQKEQREFPMTDSKLVHLRSEISQKEQKVKDKIDQLEKIKERNKRLKEAMEQVQMLMEEITKV